MRIPITKEVSLMEVKEKLEAEFPGIIVTWRGPKVLIVSQPGSRAAAQVMLMKKSFMVSESFSTLGAQMLFMLVVILFGIVIPFGIYLLTFKPKQKAVIDKIAPVLKDNWGQTSF
jgi:hypothetical protein